MSLPVDGWKNKGGTSGKACQKCGSWKQHWINKSEKVWPSSCSISGCDAKPTLGAHIYNQSSDVAGEWIAPLCDSCNKKKTEFSLKGSITLVPAKQCS